MENSIDFVAWAGVVGAILPLVISGLKQTSWPTQVKKYVSTAIAAIVAIIYTGAQEGWNVGSFSEFWSYLFTSFTVIFALAQTTYSGFWKDTSVEVRLANVGDRSA